MINKLLNMFRPKPKYKPMTSEECVRDAQKREAVSHLNNTLFKIGFLEIKNNIPFNPQKATEYYSNENAIAYERGRQFAIIKPHINFHDLNTEQTITQFLKAVKESIDKHAYATSRRSRYIREERDGMFIAVYEIKITFTTTVNDPQIRKTLFKLRIKYPEIKMYAA